MKVFVSSLISGYELLRASVCQAAESLGHQVIRAEDFQAHASSPQIACLTGVRQADVIVLVLGERYGAVQPSGLSATHEEYREARGRKPVLAFVQEDGDFESQQQSFLEEVQAWEAGLFRAGFQDADDLRTKVTRALHEWEVANAAGPADPKEMLARANELLTSPERSRHWGVPAMLRVAIVGGPDQAILRPAQIEDPSFGDELLKAALFNTPRLLDPSMGTSVGVRGNLLAVSQEGSQRRAGGSILIGPRGDMVLTLPLDSADQRSALPVLIEETVEKNLLAALQYGAWFLERVDPTQKLTHVAVAAQIDGDGFLAWRTRSEHAASPNQISQSIGFGSDKSRPVHLTPSHVARAALRMDLARVAEDLLVWLRGQQRQDQTES